MFLGGTSNLVGAAEAKATSGNPIFPGWYADPEGAVFEDRYWVYPTYSARYEAQVFFDAFSSPDLIHWTKHSRILDTNRVTWAWRAMWAPSIIAKDGLVEIGTTPSFQVHQIKTENDTQYGIIAEPPTYMLPIDDNLGVYVHKTLGQIPLWYDLGVEWSFLPIRTCTPVVVMAGLTFYEHEFLPYPVVRT